MLTGPPLTVEQGGRDLARSFAQAFDSSSIDDFAYWSGMTKTAASALTDDLAAAPTNDPTPPSTPTPAPTTVLPEFDNIYFCRRTSTADLYRAKKDRRIDPARMPGTLVADGVVVAGWKAPARTGPRLSPWTELGPAATQAWEEFAGWYRRHRPAH